MKNSLFVILVLVCCHLANGPIASAQVPNFIEPQGGFNFDFSHGLPQVHDVWFAERHYSVEEWQADAISRYVGPFVAEVTQQPLVKNIDSHVIAMKMAFVIKKPVSFLTREKYLTPAFHIATNPSIQLELISLQPLVFKARAKVFGLIELRSLVEFLYFDENEIKARPNLQQVMRYHGLSNNLPKYIVYRYAEKFNRVVELAVTSSEFYPLDEESTLVLSYAFVSANGDWFSGLQGVIAKRQLRNAFQQIISDNVNAIENLR